MRGCLFGDFWYRYWGILFVLASPGGISLSCGLIRYAALFLDFLFWLHQWGIPHRMCRFYLLLAGAVEERQGIAIPYPSPTPLLTPGGSAAAGHVCCRGLYQFRWLYSGAVVTRQVRILFGYLCSGWYRSRFSWVVGLWSFVFHYWGIGRSCLRLRDVLQWSFVGFALTAIGSFVSAGDGMGYLFPCSTSCTNAFFSTFFCPAQLVKWACTIRNWYNGAVSVNSKKRNYQAILTASFFQPIMKNERHKPNEIY